MDALSKPEGVALMKEYMESMSDPETRRVRRVMARCIHNGNLSGALRRLSRFSHCLSRACKVAFAKCVDFVDE